MDGASPLTPLQVIAEWLGAQVGKSCSRHLEQDITVLIECLSSGKTKEKNIVVRHS